MKAMTKGLQNGILQALAGDDGIFNAYNVGLVGADFDPEAIATLTDLTAPTFTGYTPKPGANPPPIYNDSDGNKILVFDVLEWFATDAVNLPQVIYGAYVEGDDATHLCVCRFDEPLNLTQADQVIRVSATFSIDREVPTSISAELLE